MLARYKYNFYFCNVKSCKRYISAAVSSVFCTPNLLVESKRKEWVNSNVPEVSAYMNLTAPIALSFLSKM